LPCESSHPRRQSSFSFSRALALEMVTASCAAAALAQTPPGPTGGVAFASEPSQTSVAGAVRVTAGVIDIDKAARSSPGALNTRGGQNSEGQQ
jgi:hypothetical protein